MKNRIIPERFGAEYDRELSRLFYLRINLFCYITIAAFAVEIIAGLIFFRELLGVKDIPGVGGGIFFSTLLLITGKINRSIRLQKARAYFFSLLLIMIATLAATAHPEVISYMGVTLILLALFPSVLLLPWSWLDATVIGLFALVNFMWIYPATGTFVNNQVFGINGILLSFAAFICAFVKRNEEILRKKDFASRKEIEEKNSIMAKELDLAKKIHKSIMPRSVKSELADIAVTYKPMLYMGGDYAKFQFIDRNRLMFILADVTGHGVSSALLVNRIHTEIERLLRESPEPGRILSALDDFINRDFGKMGYFLSAFCGLLDYAARRLVYSNYGHPPQILVHSSGNNVVLMRSQTFLMGIGMETSSVYNTDITFEKGDRVVLFTDGIIEAKGPGNEDFGQDRLEGFVKNNAGLDVTDFNDRLVSEVDRFQAGRQTDDIFLLTIQTK